MPWKALTMSEARAAFVTLALSQSVSFADACRRFSISRKTGYKWLARSREKSEQPFRDRSRRPDLSPTRTSPSIEQQIVDVRSKYGWGARKIHAFLRGSVVELPSPRTITAILHRHGCLKKRVPSDDPLQRFERSTPNELWQIDFKGPLEFQRCKFQLFDVLDDYSRFALAAELLPDRTMNSAWNTLWRLFGEVGLPDTILCDNAFATSSQVGISWFDARLVRLGIRPIHGRPYHPQTQGKIERWHGTLEAEAFPRLRWSSPQDFAADLAEWRVQVYNAIRPHEALADQPPITRWQPSKRARPSLLPTIEYPLGAQLRKVMHRGEVSWRNCEILVGNGIAGEWVRVAEEHEQVTFFYGNHVIRELSTSQLRKREIV
jgi:transposase InsO family protein